MRRQAWRSCAGKRAGEEEKKEIGELMAQGCTGMGDHKGKIRRGDGLLYMRPSVRDEGRREEWNDRPLFKRAQGARCSALGTAKDKPASRGLG